MRRKALRGEEAPERNLSESLIVKLRKGDGFLRDPTLAASPPFDRCVSARLARHVISRVIVLLPPHTHAHTHTQATPRAHQNRCVKECVYDKQVMGPHATIYMPHLLRSQHNTAAEWHSL